MLKAASYYQTVIKTTGGNGLDAFGLQTSRPSGCSWTWPWPAPSEIELQDSVSWSLRCYAVPTVQLWYVVAW